MADKVKIEFVAHHRDGDTLHTPGDTLEFDDVADAKRLVTAGVAVWATKTAAKAAGADPDTAASARA